MWLYIRYVLHSNITQIITHTAIEQNTTLVALDWTGNHLGDFAPQAFNYHSMHYGEFFAASLAKSKIERLDISENTILGDTERRYSGLAAIVKKYVVGRCTVFRCRLNRLHRCVCVSGRIAMRVTMCVTMCVTICHTMCVAMCVTMCVTICHTMCVTICHTMCVTMCVQPSLLYSIFCNAP